MVSHSPLFRFYFFPTPPSHFFRLNVFLKAPRIAFFLFFNFLALFPPRSFSNFLLPFLCYGFQQSSAPLLAKVLFGSPILLGIGSFFSLPVLVSFFDLVQVHPPFSFCPRRWSGLQYTPCPPFVFTGCESSRTRVSISFFFPPEDLFSPPPDRQLIGCWLASLLVIRSSPCIAFRCLNLLPFPSLPACPTLCIPEPTPFFLCPFFPQMFNLNCLVPLWPTSTVPFPPTPLFSLTHHS